MEGFAGKVAVVTGAGSGIGQALAIELGARAPSSPSATSTPRASAVTEERLKAIGAPVKADRLDVTEREAFGLYADAVNEHFGKVNQIYNNAGIAFIGDIEVSQFKDIERVMDVDFWGVRQRHQGVPAAPDRVRRRPRRQRLQRVRHASRCRARRAYNAAKFAVRGFTEALRQEMIVAGHPVKVTCVHPGGIKTAIARNADRRRGPRPGPSWRKFFDKRLASTTPGEGRPDHPRRRCARTRPACWSAPTPRSLDIARAADRFGLPEAVRRSPSRSSSCARAIRTG